MRVVILTLLMLSPAGIAAADPALGMWQTEPDAKDQIAHVNVYDCAEALCGRIVRVFDANGQRIDHPNVGRRVFWNMTRDGGSRYRGRAFVPAHGREYAGRMVLQGDRLVVKGCVGPVCMSQTWRRVN